MSSPTNNTVPTPSPILVEVTRGTQTESFHRGGFAIVAADGTVVQSAGDIEHPIYPRSAIKGLQALALVESGAADQFGLTAKEIALACASHSGEPEHVATAASVLAKVGLDVSALECGAHWPYNESVARDLARRGGEPNALHNNCSGKHAGFVCLACHMADAKGASRGVFSKGYIAPDHPTMQRITRVLEEMTGLDLTKAPRGTDGCSIPTYGMPLRNLAHAFAKFGTGVGLAPERAKAAKRIRESVAASPFHVGGTQRFDTRVMERLGLRAFVKIGAEGVFCATLPDQGLGVAIKIDDGTARAGEAVMAAVIAAHAKLSDAEAQFISTLANAELRNWRGALVGHLKASLP